MKKLLLSLILIAGLTYVSGQILSVDSLSVPAFSKVYIYNRHNELPHNLIIMISGDGGWKYGVPEFAAEFSELNSLVVGVNILSYYRHLKQKKDDCYMVASDFVELATLMERQFNFSEYEPPILMGYSSGATLVYGILAQARPGTFKGGISLGFCPDIELPKMLCEVNGLKATELEKGKSYLFLPSARLGNQWIVMHGLEDKICEFNTVKDFVSGTTDASLISLYRVGHDFSKWSDFMPQWKAAYSEILNRYGQEKTLKGDIAQADIIESINTIGKGNAYTDLIALFLSGDGGWYSFEQSIANRLADMGISTIGIDIKKYLWNRKDPATLSSEMASLLKYYSKKWNRQQFIIIGYSQGADVVPFLFTGLPVDIRYKTKTLVMLSPGETTDFEIHITNMLGLGNKQNTYNVVNEITKIKNTRQICVFGENEKTGVPGKLNGSQAVKIFVPGDHHYKNNSSVIVQAMNDNKAF